MIFNKVVSKTCEADITADYNSKKTLSVFPSINCLTQSIFLVCAFTVSGCVSNKAIMKEATQPQKMNESLPFDLPLNWKGIGLQSSEQHSNEPLAWINDFNDPLLVSIVNEALKNNADLKMAASRLKISQYQMEMADNAYQPTLGTQLTDSRMALLNPPEVTKYTPPQYRSIGFVTHELGLGIKFDWEFDVWGRINQQRRAAIYDYYAAENDVAAAHLSLAAQTVKRYFYAIEAREQLKIAQKNADNLDYTAKATEAFSHYGYASLSDLYLARADAARAKSSLSQAELNLHMALKGLEVMLGRYPAADITTATSLPTLPKTLDASVPSTLLERRSDILAAKLRLNAALAKTKEAKLARFPTFNISTGMQAGGVLNGTSMPGQIPGLRYIKSNFHDLFDPANFIWNFIAGLTYPIFDKGQIKAGINLSTAEQEVALYDFQNKALKAFFDVEASIDSENSAKQRLISIQDAFSDAKRAEEIADGRFKQGNSDIFSLLQIKKGTLASEMELLKLKREMLENRVDLYLSLGGNIPMQTTASK